MLVKRVGKLIEKMVERPQPLIWDLDELMTKKIEIPDATLNFNGCIHEGKLVKVWKGTTYDTRA